MIVVFGTVCLDRIFVVPRWPAPGGYAEVETESFGLGGEAANTAAALTQWGAEVMLLGNRVGCDNDGTLLLSLLDAADLFTGAKAWGERTPVCDIFVTPNGERTMIGRGFSNMDASEVFDATVLQNCRADDWLTAEPNMPRAARRAAEVAQERGMKTYLMDFIREEDNVICARCDVWQSSTDWAGIRGDMDTNLRLVQQRAEQFCNWNILTDGAQGFCAAGPNLPARHFSPFPCTHARDVTGAGDVFRAGVLFGLTQAWPIAKSFAFASSSASLNCGFLGAVSGIPSVNEIHACIEKFPEIEGSYA